MKTARGFTLIEVIVALSILAIALGTLVIAQIGAAKLSTNSLMVSQVTTVADHRLEQVADQLLSRVETFNKYRDACQHDLDNFDSRGCNFEAQDDQIKNNCSDGKPCDIDGDGTNDVILLSSVKETDPENPGQERDLDLDGDGSPERYLGYDMDYYLDSSGSTLGDPDIYVTTWLAHDNGSIRVTVAALPNPHLSEQTGRLDPVFLTRTVSCYDVQWETKSSPNSPTPYRGTAPPSCPEL